MISPAIEDYLKAIYKLSYDGRVGTVDLSKELNVSAASVTEMLQKLAKLGLINYKSHYGATLTDEGTKVALEVLRHHRLLETYLCQALGYPVEKAHKEACALEHHISEEFEERIFEKYFRGSSGEGFGLGLPIARAIANAHNGNITARNREQGGVQFSLWLPYSTPPTVEMPDEQ